MLTPILEYLHSPVFLNIAVVLLTAFALNFLARRIFNRNLSKAMNSERRTGITFLKNAVKATILIAASVAIIYSIPSLRSLAVGFFAGTSILAAL